MNDFISFTTVEQKICIISASIISLDLNTHILFLTNIFLYNINKYFVKHLLFL